MPEKNHIELCPLDELADGHSKGFPTIEGTGGQSIFLVRRKDAVYGYINSCPHTGAPLEWLPDQFLSLDGSHIQCALHGARFQIHNGLCIEGPCVNDALSPIEVSIINGVVYWVTSR